MECIPRALAANSGGDATAMYPSDPDALGRRWVGPYLDLEADFALVLQEHDREEGGRPTAVHG